jgi:hypothetical protein
MSAGVPAEEPSAVLNATASNGVFAFTKTVFAGGPAAPMLEAEAALSSSSDRGPNSKQATTSMCAGRRFTLSDQAVGIGARPRSRAAHCKKGLIAITRFRPLQGQSGDREDSILPMEKIAAPVAWPLDPHRDSLGFRFAAQSVGPARARAAQPRQSLHARRPRSLTLARLSTLLETGL